MNRLTARTFLASAALVFCGFTASAASATADERLVEHAFSENEVVRIDGKAGVQATIAFGTGETIENVAVGDSQSWQITPNKRADLLFVKPLEAAARTNMTVVTNRHTYFFDLVASAKAKPLYMLRFTYKDAPVSPPAGMAAGAPVEAAFVTGEGAGSPAEGAALNFAWKKEGANKLLPDRVYDDGSSTFLVWPEMSAVPAILVQNEKGEEIPVNYAVRGATIVLAQVPRTIILRSGRARAEIENARPLAALAPIPAPVASAPVAPVAPAASASPAAAGNGPAVAKGN